MWFASTIDDEAQTAVHRLGFQAPGGTPSSRKFRTSSGYICAMRGPGHASTSVISTPSGSVHSWDTFESEKQ